MNSLYDPYIIRKKTKWFYFRVVIATMVVLVLVVAVLLHILGLPILGILFGKKENKDFATTYFVCKNAEGLESSATEVAKTYRARGAAGIVFWENQTEYVVLGCYLNKEDANNVVANLTPSEGEAEVLQIQIEKPSVKNLSNEDKQQFETVCNFLNETIQTLDAVIVQLSKNALTDVNANLQISNLLLKARFYEQKLLEKEKLETTSYILSSVSNVLSYVCEETALTENYVSYQAELRRAFVRVVLVIYENFKNI